MIIARKHYSIRMAHRHFVLVLGLHLTILQEPGCTLKKICQDYGDLAKMHAIYDREAHAADSN
jgi:hypothetical protein